MKCRTAWEPERFCSITIANNADEKEVLKKRGFIRRKNEKRENNRT